MTSNGSLGSLTIAIGINILIILAESLVQNSYYVKLKFKLDRKSLETIYLTFIGPHRIYGDVICDNCTQFEKNALDKIQNEAARTSVGTTKLVSLNNLYKKKSDGRPCTNDDKTIKLL